MINSDQESNSTDSPTRRTPIEEEQLLCNEALRTDAFDAISDNEWVALCERVALRGRLAAKDDALSDSSPDTASRG